eukprot:TRINITY_DN3343_c0_g1_i2.p1 TRINITY_DN3343_c0_g1~~TRINITY_DN3343_c0_g1_i2.p1  ORF type:complete len:356 (+),score=71.83 TRINITY_DN3343_c0_g1_i2:79-1146(+)
MQLPALPQLPRGVFLCGTGSVAAVWFCLNRCHNRSCRGVRRGRGGDVPAAVEDPQCCICLGPAGPGDSIGCACQGTMLPKHVSCIMDWVRTQELRRKAPTCPGCTAPLSLIPVYPRLGSALNLAVKVGGFCKALAGGYAGASLDYVILTTLECLDDDDAPWQRSLMLYGLAIAWGCSVPAVRAALASWDANDDTVRVWAGALWMGHEPGGVEAVYFFIDAIISRMAVEGLPEPVHVPEFLLDDPGLGGGGFVDLGPFGFVIMIPLIVFKQLTAPGYFTHTTVLGIAGAAIGYLLETDADSHAEEPLLPRILHSARVFKHAVACFAAASAVQGALRSASLAQPLLLDVGDADEGAQ